MTELGIEVAIVSETWERRNLFLRDLLKLTNHKIVSYYRPLSKTEKQIGGGAAVVYSEKRFEVVPTSVCVPKGVEACWLVLRPKTRVDTIKNIAICSVYVSPSSKHKTSTIIHIIEAIHLLRSKFDNSINYIIAGDLNRLKIDRILDSYGPLKQIVTSATRKSAILEYIITDLHTLYQAPVSLEPLQVDDGKIGKNSDHNMVILSPIMISNNKQYEKRTVVTRPLTLSGWQAFGEVLRSQNWEEVFNETDIDKKVEMFHQTLRKHLDLTFPEKTVKLSTLDRKWMTPQLKKLIRKIKREFYMNRKSPKWRSLKSKFKKLKRNTIKQFYSDFVTELKVSNPGKWYSMAKRLGATENHANNLLQVESLAGLSKSETVEKIAAHFSQISQEYEPLNIEELPAFLPAPKVLSVSVEEVARRLRTQKVRKSTQPIDLPSKLRKEFSWELAIPLADIFNNCLAEHYYPQLWKHEWVVPVPKVTNPQTPKDLRKISLTSEFSLTFESFIKDWILEDISANLDKSQFGNRIGTGTEHLLVKFMDKILKLIDENKNQSAVIATMLDWASAFDRQDPTLAIRKFLKMGVRTELIPVLSSYLTNRKMQVRLEDKLSSTYHLPGGGAQGTLLGVLQFLVQNNDNADCLEEDMRYKFVDDLSILELLLFGGLLSDYNFMDHVASDIGIDESFIPSSNLQTQKNLDTIARWTDDNKMKLNEKKTNYMIFSRSSTEIATRLTLNGQTLDRVEEVKLLGLWITTWLDWTKHTKEICKSAYARMTMLTKLKYVGTSVNDLIDIYILYIRSILEYCSVVWHSTLTVEQSNQIEAVQKLCLKIILGEGYTDYKTALEITGLDTLESRREGRCLKFGLRCLLHPIHKSMFPVNPNMQNPHTIRRREHFKVNKAKSESYRMSAIPYIQRKLNSYVVNQNN